MLNETNKSLRHFFQLIALLIKFVNRRKQRQIYLRVEHRLLLMLILLKPLFHHKNAAVVRPSAEPNTSRNQNIHCETQTKTYFRFALAIWPFTMNNSQHTQHHRKRIALVSRTSQSLRKPIAIMPKWKNDLFDAARLHRIQKICKCFISYAKRHGISMGGRTATTT